MVLAMVVLIWWWEKKTSEWASGDGGGSDDVQMNRVSITIITLPRHKVSEGCTSSAAPPV